MTADAERLAAIRARFEEVGKHPLGRLLEHMVTGQVATYTSSARSFAITSVQVRDNSAADVADLLDLVTSVAAERDALRVRIAAATVLNEEWGGPAQIDDDPDLTERYWELRAALAGDRPEATPEPNDESGHTDHTDPYCATHCIPGIKHSQCGCTRSHAKTTPEPSHLDPEPWVGSNGQRWPRQTYKDDRFDPLPADENGKAYSQNPASYGVQS